MSSNKSKNKTVDRYNMPDFDYESAAEYLGLSVRQVKRARDAGKIGCIKPGGLYVRFSQAQLDAYVELCTIAPKSAR